MDYKHPFLERVLTKWDAYNLQLINTILTKGSGLQDYLCACVMSFVCVTQWSLLRGVMIICFESF